MNSIKVKFNSAEIVVDYRYDAEEKEVRTFSNGDPGYPCSPACLEIQKIEYNGVDVTELFDKRMDEEVEDLIYAKWNEMANDI